MKKRLVLVSEAAASRAFFADRLVLHFGDAIELHSYSVEQNNFSAMPLDADLYVITSTSSEAFGHIVSIIPPDRSVVSSKLTFFRKEIETLRKLPRGTRALLVNLSVQMSIESIAELQRLGITHIDFVPCYPGAPCPAGIPLAITPGEMQYVPEEIRDVIDLGDRVFTSDTLLEIAVILGFTWFPKHPAFQEYAASLADQGQSLAALWSSGLKAETYLDILMGALETGILGVDTEGRVFALNSVAEQILGLPRKELAGSPLAAACPELAEQLSPADPRQRSSRLVKLADTFINLSTVPVDWQGEWIGDFLLLQRFTKEEERQHNFRQQLRHWGYQSKYTFDDIVGESDVILQTKRIARRMAETDAAILLTGESGTGKELFAHAIHHASRRRMMPFVAINCAALSENLLESELFGYDEGAFTGAKKGGKLGLFEYAHLGTLFLDEIEAMSQTLQAKLLRVLQEKEFIRVGGDRIIPTDVRIIAASNENIREHVLRGKFRKDLYYRLNTLPVEIPPLRERGDDVFLIAQSLMKKSVHSYTFTPAARQVLRSYAWDGNIRELSNLIEYLSITNKNEIDAGDLPPYLRLTTHAAAPSPPEPGGDFQAVWQAAQGREELFRFVIHALGPAERGAGRGALLQEARRRQIPATEQELRDVLRVLNRLGMVSVSRGRGGSRLTQAGRGLLSTLTER